MSDVSDTSVLISMSDVKTQDVLNGFDHQKLQI